MEVMFPACAGLDVHKRQVTACRRVARQGKPEIEVREFGTTTRELLALSDWLEEAGVTHACMESTGSYWKPVYQVLEGRFELLVANAQHVKAVPGRKTDVKDAQWLAELYAHGLLRPSFVPKEEQRALRELTRTRASFVQERARLSNRIQRVLEEANVKLASVASDVLGVSGRAMLAAMAGGEDDPAALAGLAKGRLKAKATELEEALEGRLLPHHRLVLGEMLAHVESLDGSIGRLDAAIERAMAEAEAPFESGVALLDTVPGVAPVSARTLLAEIGVDMDRFGTAERLCAWVGIVPGDCQSGGKRLSSRLRKGNRAAKTILVQMAHGAIRSGDGYLRALYERIARRRGKKKAIVAVAHSMLVAVFHMLKRGEPYRDLGKDFFERKKGPALARALARRLQSLGYEVQIREPSVS
jgi:transposase